MSEGVIINDQREYGCTRCGVAGNYFEIADHDCASVRIAALEGRLAALEAKVALFGSPDGDQAGVVVLAAEHARPENTGYRLVDGPSLADSYRRKGSERR